MGTTEHDEAITNIENFTEGMKARHYGELDREQALPTTIRSDFFGTESLGVIFAVKMLTQLRNAIPHNFPADGSKSTQTGYLSISERSHQAMISMMEKMIAMSTIGESERRISTTYRELERDLCEIQGACGKLRMHPTTKLTDDQKRDFWLAAARLTAIGLV